MADKGSERSLEKGMELFSECLAGMIYSDEEIREVMSPEDADEFIELRNVLLHPDSSCKRVIGEYGCEGYDNLPLAAEEEEPYK